MGNLFNPYTFHGVLLGVYKMKYRLKDKKLHETLDQISNGDFSKKMEGVVDLTGQLWFGKHNEFAIYLSYFRFEKIFDPNEWNEYPQITPPEFVPLILKEIYYDGSFKYFAVMYKCGLFYMTDYEGSERCLELGVAKYFVKGLPQ